MNGSYQEARNLCGTNGGSPQSCPLELNKSGGAPTLTSFAKTSCHIQASAPSGATPTGRSCIIFPADEAAFNCSSSKYCNHLWNRMRSPNSTIKANTAGLSGERYCCAHARQFAPNCSARTQKLANSCRVRPRPGSKSLKEVLARIWDQSCSSVLIFKR